MTGLVLIALGVSIGAWAVRDLLRRRRASHRAAWGRVARRLGMSREESALLHRVALAAGLRTALSLIVSTGCYDRAVRRYQRQVGADRRLAALRQLIYGSGAAATNPHAPPQVR